MKTLSSSRWLHSAPVDTTFILAPAFFTSLLAIAFHDMFDSWHDMPLWAWVSLVLCIDVAHVYATLFRTYWHPQGRQRHYNLLVSAPLLVWIVGVLLYTVDDLWFWRVLAYLAVFHFIRQQYGFVRLYSRGESAQRVAGIDSTRIDEFMVYSATLFPVIWWHTTLPREFHWFVEYDFARGLPGFMATAAAVLYAAITLLFIASEQQRWRNTGQVNLPKYLLIGGTACSWFVGIVAFDNDMAFTLTNVISHGVPYMALVWIYNQRDRQQDKLPLVSGIQKISWVPVLFVGTLLGLAYLEEGLWDALVWREHTGFFSVFHALPTVHQHALLALLVPLLTVPQATHYVLDGFIWKSGK